MLTTTQRPEMQLRNIFLLNHLYCTNACRCGTFEMTQVKSSDNDGEISKEFQNLQVIMWKKLLKEVLQEQQENRLYKDVEINLIRQCKYIKTVLM